MVSSSSRSLRRKLGGDVARPSGKKGVAMAKTLLIIEDDSNIRELLRLYLEQEGYAIESAADGAEGLRAFKRIHPDLVLLDVMMPNKIGRAHV